MSKRGNSRHGRYTLALFVVASSLVLMGSQCAPIKEPIKEPAPPPSASLSISPDDAWDFTDVVLGDTSSQTFRVTNTGSAKSGLIAVSLVDVPVSNEQSPFDYGSNCGPQLVPGKFCFVFVGFEPQLTGPQFAKLVVSADPGGTLTVRLRGYGQPAP